MAQRFDGAEAPAHAAPAAKALGGLVENALDQFLGDARDAMALLGRNVRHFLQLLFEKKQAMPMKAAAKIVHDRPCFERGAPGLKLGDVLGDDRFHARDFGFTRFFVLLDDLAQVVDIVEIKIVESCGRGVDVSRHAQIHHENRPPAARGNGALEHLARENRPGAARGSRR